MRDWRGTPIKQGCKVVYPGRHGSNSWMNEGEVVELHPAKNPNATSYWERDKDWVEVRRLREQSYNSPDAVDPKIVKVGLRLLTVVESAP